jgi:multiple sugar transport system substrate-binding protein
MKNKILVGLILVLLVGVAAASAAATQEKEKVVFWFGASQDERAAYEAMVDEFNRAHPNIEVRGMLVPQKYVERKLILSVAGGVPPDVVRFYTHLGGELMSRGGLEPLNDLIERDKVDLTDFWPVGLEQNTYQGKLYGMPWVMSPNALFYNKSCSRRPGSTRTGRPRPGKSLRNTP